MLHGVPGSGKSSTIKSIANYTKRHIIIVDLSSILDLYDLMNMLYKPNIGNTVIPLNKRIYVFEDIDCNTSIVCNRKNTQNDNNSEKPSITLSNVLNCLDGVLELNDVIIIMTTNHIEKLDPALIRPGRINRVIELTKLDSDSMREMIKYKYQVCVKDSLIKNKVITPATLNNLMLVSETIEELEEQLSLEYSKKK
jgi:chaperone BCS1